MLRASLRVPPHERAYLEDVAKFRAERGQPPPPELVDIPDVETPHLELWQCFQSCWGSRQVGMDVSPIQCSEVESWCRMHSVPRWRQPSFWRVVHRLDAVGREKPAEGPGK